MKTYKNLYPRIYSFENLYLAYKAAARRKRGQPNVALFEMNLPENLLQLEEELVSRTYRPGPYYNFRITHPKPRLISAAPFRDRVVHHALVRQIEPILERRFIHNSYACRVGKGTHRALDCCTHFARRYRYVLRCDIVHFFPSVDHAILRDILARPIADDNTLWLIDQILDSGVGILSGEYKMQWFPGDDLLTIERPRGLPIGNLTSQFWANCYLDLLDQFVKRELKCPAYLRYCDDFMLFGDHKPTLWRWKGEIADFSQTLRLRLHQWESTVFPVAAGIPFLGFHVYPDHRRLKRHNGVGFQRRFRSLLNTYATGTISQEQLEASVQGWLAHAAHGDTWGLRRALLSSHPIPRR
jgi:RNA-directed DNA polymerase